jgi:hypothetical protein
MTHQAIPYRRYACTAFLGMAFCLSVLFPAHAGEDLKKAPPAALRIDKRTTDNTRLEKPSIKMHLRGDTKDKRQMEEKQQERSEEMAEEAREESEDSNEDAKEAHKDAVKIIRERQESESQVIRSYHW